MKTLAMHHCRRSRFDVCHRRDEMLRGCQSSKLSKRTLPTIVIQCGVLFAALFSAGAAPQLSIPLFDGLGRHHHPVTTKWPLAQRYFDQGYTLCYNFNHAEAVRAFEAAATIDPECARSEERR